MEHEAVRGSSEREKRSGSKEKRGSMRRPAMPRLQRAKQFAPYQAWAGLDIALRAKLLKVQQTMEGRDAHRIDVT